MVFAVAAAVLNCVWLAPLHPDAIGLIVGLNLAVAAAATAGFVAIATRASRRPEVVVLLVLAVVDIATITLGVYHPVLVLFVAGYLLLLPTIVALLTPWATSVHVTWLVIHGAAIVGYMAIQQLLPVAGAGPGGDAPERDATVDDGSIS